LLDGDGISYVFCNKWSRLLACVLLTQALFGNSPDKKLCLVFFHWSYLNRDMNWIKIHTSATNNPNDLGNALL